MGLEFELAGSQIDGARDYQEDAFLITHLTDGAGNPSALIVVADGMGGHAAGNVASNMAVQAFNKNVSANYPSDKINEILEQSVHQANDSIRETVTETEALSGMGCTIVAGILEDGKLWWASVGDSHLYLVRKKELIKKNADHSYGGFLDRMKAAGTPVEAEAGLARNMLMSAITGDEINEIDVSDTPFELKSGDKVIICSDGLDTLKTDNIIEYADQSKSPKELANALMVAVEDRNVPRQDNTTAVVVYVKKARVAEKQPKPDKTDTGTDKDRPARSTATAQQPRQFEAEDRPKGKAGKIFGILAVLLLAAAGAAYYLLEYKKQPKPDVARQTPPAETVTTEETGKTVTSALDAIPEAEVPAEAAQKTEEETAATPEEITKKPEEKIAGKTQKTFQDTLQSGGKGPLMIVIPAGEFKMGSYGASPHTTERPQHTVQVESFAVSQYEITFAEYDLFAKSAGRKIPKNNGMDRNTHPVIYVNWDDAFQYAKWLSKQTGHKYRLPSEAHWEYMAAAGQKTPFWWGHKQETGHAHCFGCGTGLDPRRPAKTGSFAPNPFGVYDTAGNVSEWVHDCWHKNYNDAPDNAEVWEGGDCTRRAVRGGSYSSPPQSIRSVKRDKYRSDGTYDHIGIRIIRDLK